MFMRGDRKSFAFNISSVANQRVPTSAALTLRKVESLLLRQSSVNSLRKKLPVDTKASLILRPSEHQSKTPNCPLPPKLERSTSMSSPRPLWIFLSLWLLIIATYTAASLALPRDSSPLVTFADLVQCVVPLIANAGLLLNAGTPHWRRNIFWMLLALSCTLWMLGQLDWTYHEVYAHRAVPTIYGGDIVFFLKGIPLMAALALQPHRQRGQLQLRFGYLDFILLLTWWTFLYAFVVFPWMYAAPSEGQYNFNYDASDQHSELVIVADWDFCGCVRKARGGPCTQISSAAPRCTCFPRSPSMWPSA